MGATALTFELARLLGLDDCCMATDQDKLLLRLFTPIAKLYTAKQIMAVTSEGLEAIGGQGYIEETGLPAMLRDAQVLPIWEGTTSILSLDVLRAIQKTDGEVMNAFYSACQQNLSKADLKDTTHKLKEAAEWLSKVVYQLPDEGMILEMSGRDLAYSLARVYIGTLLAKLSSHNGEQSRAIATACQRWCSQDLIPIKAGLEEGRYTDSASDENWQLVFGEGSDM